MASRKLLSERFWQKVDIRNGAECWPWMGALNADGYGGIGKGGRGSPVIGAHRVAWFLEHREWPDEQVLHRCDNPACVRVSHLFLGSHADNMRDRREKGRCADNTGERNPAAKLTEEQVWEIRQLGAMGHPKRALARRFGTSQSNVARIINRQIWKHV